MVEPMGVGHRTVPPPKYATASSDNMHLTTSSPALVLLQGVPVSKEPSGLFPGDNRRPDGITLIPFRVSKIFIISFISGIWPIYT